MARKRKLFRIYSFDNSDIQETIKTEKTKTKTIKNYYYDITKNERELRLKEVKLTENILIKAYCIYTKQEFIDNMLTTDIIKIMISKGDKIGKRQLKGIDFNNVEYVAWFSSTGGMKKEDLTTHSKSEWYFVRKDLKGFIDWFENAISLGKLKALEGEEICINADVISRISLATSGTTQTSIKPKIIILPECSYKVISDVVTLESDKIVELKDKEVDTTPFDGCGLMSPGLADMIQQEMGLDYKVDFAVIRMYNGLAIKGLVTRFNFIEYFNEFYEGDTDYFKKVDDKFYIKDKYKDDWQCANDADMILNESMVKWAKHWNHLDEVYETLKDNEFDDCRGLLSSLYITKVNKDPKALSDYTLTNYQLLSNISITEKELNALSAETERIYREILNGNEDVTRLFWGDIIKNVTQDDDGRVVIEETDNMSTQAQKLLTINPEFIKTSYVRRAVARMIEKKIKLLASGKFYIKGNYKFVAGCPLTYLDWIMQREGNFLIKSKNGLKANEFYCVNIDNEEVRTVSRCPLNSFSEVQNIKFTRNVILDKYLGHLSSELLFLNEYDLLCAICSGMDKDGDIILVTDEEIIKNSVVEDLPLVNFNDGEKEYMEYNAKNRIDANLKPSGNIIGSLAHLGMSVCNKAQMAGYRMYRKKGTDKIYSYDMLWNEFKEKFQEKYKGNTYLEFVKRLEEHFEYIEDYYSEEELKEQIKEGFYNFRRDSYKLRFLQQEGIDAPKTLKLPTVPKLLNEKYKKKPRFLYYAKDYIKKYKTENDINALNLHANRIAHELLREDIERKKSKDRLDLLEKYMSCPKFAVLYPEDYLSCKSDIENLYSQYKSEVSDSDYNLKMNEAKNYYYSNLKLFKEQLFNEKITKAKYKLLEEKLQDEFDFKVEEITNKYLMIKLRDEAECLFIADKLLEKYEKELISHALINLKCSESFIFKFFFKAVAKVIEMNSIDVQKYTYVEDENGDIEYLYRRFKKVPVVRSSGDIDKLHNEGREQLLNKLVNQSKNGFIKQVNIGGIKIDNFSFNKVTIKEDDYVDKRTNEERKTIKLFVNDKEIGFVYPQFYNIDDFRTLFDYKDKEVNFEPVKTIKNGVVGRLSYIA